MTGVGLSEGCLLWGYVVKHHFWLQYKEFLDCAGFSSMCSAALRAALVFVRGLGISLFSSFVDGFRFTS